MKKYLILVGLLAIGSVANAQFPDPTGVWEGKIRCRDLARGSLTVSAILFKGPNKGLFASPIRLQLSRQPGSSLSISIRTVPLQPDGNPDPSYGALWAGVYYPDAKRTAAIAASCGFDTEYVDAPLLPIGLSAQATLKLTVRERPNGTAIMKVEGVHNRDAPDNIIVCKARLKRTTATDPLIPWPCP